MTPDTPSISISTESAKSTNHHIAVHNRLVRDRIPDILESMGNIVVWKELDDENFAKAVLEAVVRASQQFRDTESLESLADLLELVESWLELRGLTMEEVSMARKEKRKRCGTFERRRFLELVADAQQADAIAAREPRC